MVRPANFGFNQETAINNAFQRRDDQQSPLEIQAAAVREFDAMVKVLKQHGIQIIVAEDASLPAKPDAIFPNNWVSFHQDGSIFTYPMFSPLRRLERNIEFVEQLKTKLGFQQIFSLEKYEAQEQFLEGTGSMVLDRPHQLAYACESPRTNPAVLQAFCELAGYEAILFKATDKNGVDIYHTNVMMAVGKDFAIICEAAISDPADLARVRAAMERTGKQIIPISFAQVNAFAGNMLQVKNPEGKDYLVMSSQAYQSLTQDQIAKIETFTQILHSPINHIEKYGGGSTRCMMAEVFSVLKEP